MGHASMSDTAGDSVVAITPQRLLRWASSAGAVVIGAGYVEQIPNLFLQPPTRDGWFDFFNLEAEMGSSAWYSSLLLFLVGALMLWSATIERRQGRGTWPGWLILGIGFVYMSLDEMSMIHEHTGALLENTPNFFGLFQFHWVEFGLAVCLVVAVAFIPFLLRLPRITAVRLVIAGAVYVGGAVGMEMVGGAISAAQGYTRLYVLATMLEETLEIVGALLALRCVSLHLAEVLGGTGITLLRRR